MNKSIILTVVLLFNIPFLSYASTNKWCGFDDIYVGMPASAAKSLGFNKCTPSKVFKGDVCTSTTNKYQTFSGEKIKQLEVGYQNNKVIGISVITFSGGDKNIVGKMSKTYGRPYKKGGNWSQGYASWLKGDKFITMSMDTGTNDIYFCYDPEKKNK